MESVTFSDRVTNRQQGTVSDRGQGIRIKDQRIESRVKKLLLFPDICILTSKF